MGTLVVLKALEPQLLGVGRGTRSASWVRGGVEAGLLVGPIPGPCSLFSCSQGRGSAWKGGP